MQEDYVSIESAKLLKEKGYDVPDYYCSRVFSDKGTLQGVNTVRFEGVKYICAPTLQMAMKWLREEHNLFIGIHPRLSFTDYYWITADIYRVRKKGSVYHAEDVDDYNCVACCDGTSFEEACEAAIKYCLENLL